MFSADLPPVSSYAQLHELCQQFQAQLQSQENPSETVAEQAAAIAATLVSLRTAFQQCFTALAEAEAARVQPIQIEINKQLRLLEADAQFLKAARQPQTLQQRQQQIGQRLDLLGHYAATIADQQAESGVPEAISEAAPEAAPEAQDSD